MKSETKKGTLMTEGSIIKNILFFAIPLILGNLLQQLYNTADSIIVGNFVGKNALAAVGSSTSVIYLLIAFSQGASVGAGVVVSQYLGAKKKKETEDAVHTALAISVILGVILTIGGVLFSRRLLLWMHTPEEVFDGAVLYLQIYSGGLLFNVLYNMAAGILNAGGNSKRSLIYLAYASVTNIILDLVLIRGFGMGVEGAAIATDISQVVSSVLATGYLMRVKADYRVSLRKIKIHRQMAGRIVKIGLPTGIQNMVISLSNILVQSSVNGFGADAVAIWRISEDRRLQYPSGYEYQHGSYDIYRTELWSRKDRPGKERHVGDDRDGIDLYDHHRNPASGIFRPVDAVIHK